MDLSSTSTSSSSPYNVFTVSVLYNNPRSVLLGGLAFYVAYGYFAYSSNSAARRAWFRPVTLAASAVLTAIGFGFNLVDDIRDAVNDGRTAVWQKAMDALVLFLRESGLDEEFDGTLSSTHLLPSLLVLTDLQNKVQRERRGKLKQGNGVIDPTDLTLGQVYMRFATAVYGPEMMASTELAVYDEVKGKATDTTHQLICTHCHLHEKDTEIWWDYRRDPTTAEIAHAQHCLLLVNHNAQQVVLAVRGTFSLSGIITDLAGYCEPFCNGMAHAGMAMAAKQTWNAIWQDGLRDKLQELEPNYDFVITGHSLGAGVACLINILVHDAVERGALPELASRRISCFAMAPPPVYCPLSAAQAAVANTTAYIHQYDCVPSLSVDAIRRLMACLDRLQAVLRKHPVWELAAQRWELGEPQPELVVAYQHPKETPLRPLEKAPMLVVPARKLIWLEKQIDEMTGNVTEYQAHALDPTLYADRVFDLELPDCVANHMTPEYETAFAKLLGEGKFTCQK